MKNFLKYFLVIGVLWFAVGVTYSSYLAYIGLMDYSWPNVVLISAGWPWFMLFFMQHHAIYLISYVVAIIAWVLLWAYCKTIFASPIKTPQ